MTALTIDRFTTTAHVPDGDDVAGTRVRRLADGVAGTRLDAAIANVPLLPGEWCIQRVDVPVVLDLERPDLSLEEQWAQALIAALARALDESSPDVVCYPRTSDGLRDLLVSVARGSVQREWAWRRVGLLGPGEPSPATHPGAAALCAARRFPRDAVRALVECVREVGIPAVHRLLGSAGWAEFAALACACTGYVVPAPQSTAGETVRRVRPPSESSAAARLADAACVRSVLASQFVRAPIRRDREIAQNWAMLIAAESDPSILARTNASAVIESISARFETGPGDVASGLGVRTPGRTAEPVSPERDSTKPRAAADTAALSDRALGPHQDVAADAAPASERAHEPDSDSGDAAAPRRTFATIWAGLLFFLNTAAAADIPQAILDDPELADRPLSHALSAVAECLIPAGADDPAILALAGRLPDPDVIDAFSDAEADRLAHHAARWMSVTADRIDDPSHEPAEICRRIALRRGIIDVEPGWIDVRLDLSDVDVDVRIAGLDIDPGWVPWLGTVVRFSYD
jgi:hypothetical protein